MYLCTSGIVPSQKTAEFIGNKQIDSHTVLQTHKHSTLYRPISTD